VRARSAVGAVGRVLVACGLLLLLFVAYQLWGTGLIEARHQTTLRREFQVELTHVKATETTLAPSDGTTRASDPRPPSAATVPPAEGQPIGVIEIPSIGVDVVAVEGTSESDLSLGPGLYYGSPLPGQRGNAAIAGHRTTYGGPFFNLNRLVNGAPIYITTLEGRYHFSVTQVLVVDPTDIAVVAPTPFAELTLTTCDPPFSASQRLVVHARLVGLEAPSPPPSPPRPRSSPTKGGGKAGVTVTTRVTSEVVDLAGGTGNWLAAVWWGLGCLAFALGVFLVARRRRRSWPIYLASLPVLVVLLFFFFEGISPIVPASF
jgi:sortase A